MTSALVEAVNAIKKGHIALLIDDLDSRETGHLLSAAACATETLLSRIINNARGVVLAAISETRLKELNLHPSQHSQHGELAIAVEARFGVSTGVSAADRAHTLQTLATTTRPRTELVIPGHIFPHLSKDGGVLVRAGTAEAACDLVERAGYPAVATIAQCLDKKGFALQGNDLHALATSLNCPVVTISELLYDRLGKESLVEQVSNAKMPLPKMEHYRAIPFRSKIDAAEHLALVRGDISAQKTPILVRVQTEQRIPDLFGVGPRASRETIQRALTRIDQEGCGVFIYIRHPRRGIVAKQVAELGREKEAGNESNRAVTLREYGIGTQILKSLGIRSLRLLSSKLHPIDGIENFQIEIVSQEVL